MEQFRNIGIIGRLGSAQVLDTIRRLKTFLIERHLQGDPGRTPPASGQRRREHDPRNNQPCG